MCRLEGALVVYDLECQGTLGHRLCDLMLCWWWWSLACFPHRLMIERFGRLVNYMRPIAR